MSPLSCLVERYSCEKFYGDVALQMRENTRLMMKILHGVPRILELKKKVLDFSNINIQERNILKHLTISADYDYKMGHVKEDVLDNYCAAWLQLILSRSYSCVEC